VTKNSSDCDGPSCKPIGSFFPDLVCHLPDPPPLGGTRLYTDAIEPQQIPSKRFVTVGLVIKKSCTLREYTDADYAFMVGILYSLRKIKLLKSKHSSHARREDCVQLMPNEIHRKKN